MQLHMVCLVKVKNGHIGTFPLSFVRRLAISQRVGLFCAHVQLCIEGVVNGYPKAKRCILEYQMRL